MTKISTLAAGVALSALMITGAVASDLNGGSMKDAPSFEAPAVVNWSGFYVGGAIGYGNSNHNLSVHDYFKDFCADQRDAEAEDFDPFDNEQHHDRGDTLENINKGIAAKGWPDWKKAAKLRSDCATQAGHVAQKDDGTRDISTTPWNNTVAVDGDSRQVGSLDGVNAHGVVGDVRLGYDRAMGRFLVGLWGSYGLNGMEAESVNTIAGFLPSAKLEKQDEWMLGARAGMIVAPRTLAYILAGYANTSYKFSGVETITAPGGKAFSKETDFSGVVVGGGVEFALASNVFLGVEYQHTFYGEEAIFDVYNKTTNIGGRINDDLDEDKIMGTLKIKLNSDVFGR